jgi:hypothetical protein
MTDKMAQHAPRYGRLLAGCLGMLVLTGGQAPALSAAEGARNVELKFDIIAHGTRAYDLDIVYKLSPSDYRATARAATTGLVGLFVDEELNMAAMGSLSSGRVRPANFRYSAREGSEKKTAQVSWDGGSVKVDRSFRMSREREEDLNQAVDKSLPDPLSGILAASMASGDKPCSGRQRVFDGKEVFELSFSYLGQETVKSAGAFEGPAHKCRVQYKSVAGLSKKRMAKNHSNPPVFTILFATVEGPAGNLLVPVAGSGELKGKKVQIVARHAKVDGKPLGK